MVSSISHGDLWGHGLTVSEMTGARLIISGLYRCMTWVLWSCNFRNIRHLKVKFRYPSCSLDLLLVLVTVLLFLPAGAVGLDELSPARRKLLQGETTDYDYKENDDSYWSYMAWQEQSMLGKGEKIGEEQPDNVYLTSGQGLDDIYKSGGAEVNETSEETHLAMGGESENTGTARPDLEFAASCGTTCTLQDSSHPANTSYISTHFLLFHTSVPGHLPRQEHPGQHPSGTQTSSDLEREATSTSSPELSKPSLANSSSFFLCDGLPCRKAHSNGLGERGSLNSGQKRIIYIAGLFPWSHDIPAGSVGRGVLPAVYLALGHVNHDTTINRKYILRMSSNDTRVST